MLISRRHRFIFVHISKTAGTSVFHGLKRHAGSGWQRAVSRQLRRMGMTAPFDPQPFPNHASAARIRELLGPETYARYFSFAFVRNPWDRLTSLYHYAQQIPEEKRHPGMPGCADFDEFVRLRIHHAPITQRQLIYGSSGECLVDFVGKFENLDSDFAEVCARVGIKAALPKLNSSNNRNYRDQYTPETRELVGRAFADDIETFGYEF